MSLENITSRCAKEEILTFIRDLKKINKEMIRKSHDFKIKLTAKTGKR